MILIALAGEDDRAVNYIVPNLSNEVSVSRGSGSLIRRTRLRARDLAMQDGHFTGLENHANGFHDQEQAGYPRL